MNAREKAFGQLGIKSPADTLFARTDRRDFLRFNKQISAFSFVATTVATLLLFVVACSRSNPTQTFPTRQIVDESGRSITVPIKVDRFVSLAPNLTEIAYAIGAGDRLVGNTTYCDYPAAARQIEKVGDTLHPSVEKILALRPQVVLVSTASQLEAFTTQLAQQQIAVYVTDPHDLEGVFRSIANLGQLLNQPREAEQLVTGLRKRTAKVEETVKSSPRVRLFYQLSAEPLYTAGRDSFVTDIIHRAGGDSVTANVPGAWPRYSAESALAAEPEVIILPTGGSMGNANSIVSPALAKSPAVKNGRIVKINDDHLTRPGPRSVDGLEELANALHPEVFQK